MHFVGTAAMLWPEHGLLQLALHGSWGPPIWGPNPSEWGMGSHYQNSLAHIVKEEISPQGTQTHFRTWMGTGSPTRILSLQSCVAPGFIPWASWMWSSSLEPLPVLSSVPWSGFLPMGESGLLGVAEDPTCLINEEPHLPAELGLADWDQAGHNSLIAVPKKAA